MVLSGLFVPAALATSAPAAMPQLVKRADAPKVNMFDGAQVTGKSSSDVEIFNGIPYAQPPVGSKRLMPPERFVQNTGEIDATKDAPACPQFRFARTDRNILGTIANGILELPILEELSGQEDCLTIDIARPANTKTGDRLPILFWIYGGGFASGSTKSYNPTSIVTFGTENKQPFIYVGVNYRLGGFGFLPGKEVLQDGSANLGLLDQRMGLEWVADNIESFGGDPSKVTIWGQSAGAISVFDQLLLYGGNATYKGKPLFRGAIMNSGTAIPADRIDSRQAQLVYDTIVKAAGCSNAGDSLTCLRELPYEDYLRATQSVPTLFAFNSEAISYLPRPDGTILQDSPEQMATDGRLHAVPMIIGDLEDEGTIFSTHQFNVTTPDDMVEYLSQNLLDHVSKEDLKEYVSLYEPAATNGSPFRTSLLNSLYPGYKRVAAILGDLIFTGMRRVILKILARAKPEMPMWSYHATYNYGVPLVGTFHASDVFQLFRRSILPNNYVKSCLGYYSNFIYNLDPNNGTGGKLATWPLWNEKQELLLFESRLENSFIQDDFRSGPIGWIEKHLNMLHI